VELWNLKSRVKSKSFDFSHLSFNCSACSQSGKYIFANKEEGYLMMYDVEEQKEEHTFEVNGIVSACAFTKDDSLMYIVTWGGDF